VETQWQEHAVLGFLAGTVRRADPFPSLSEKIDGSEPTDRHGKAAKSKKTSAAAKVLINCPVANRLCRSRD